MSQPRPPRPSQVTLAAWLIMVGAVLVVLASFETISGLRSLETRETLEQVLEVPPYSGLGLDISGLRQIIRVAAMVVGACAAVAAPSAYLVLRRDRTARVVLSAVAVPMLLAGLVASVFLTSVVAVSVLMLWLQPARAWFAGTWTPAPPVPRQPDPTAQPPTTPTVPPPQQPVPQAPPPWPPAPGGAAYGVPAVGWPGAARPAAAHEPRPHALIWATVLTWAFSGLALVLAAFALALVAGDPDWTIEQFRGQNPDLADQSLSDAELIRGTYVAGGVLVVWSLAACVVACFAFLGRHWGRVALAVSLAGTGFWLAVSVLLGQLVMLVPLLAAAAAFWLLHRPEVRRWFAARRGGMGS